jgi:acylphosphatase
MKTLEFVIENGKHFKVETFKQEIDLSEVPKQISWLEKSINSKKAELQSMENDLKEIKKFKDVEKIS